ncbi:MAG TPA: phosphodiester glycosidase family protein [Acidimicrobiales bacterium]|nr:phosphodiester glycosidase family protein [Acidimicrobiales bacterium]
MVASDTRRPVTKGPRPPSGSDTGKGIIRRHKIVSALLLVVVLLTPVWWSIGSALGNPSMGTSVASRMAEWFRLHGGRSVVTWAENTWYSHHAPPVGGRPPKGAIPTRTRATGTHPKAITRVPSHLTPPAPIQPIASPAVPGEGQWRPAGRLVDGIPAVYETDLRPDTVHTSVVTAVAWMDTKLLGATLYSGSTIPGGGPYHLTAPILPQAADSLVASFNSGFLMRDSNGGYYTEGKTVVPLRQGAASFVIDRDGTATIGEWGRDVSMTPNVVAVRQNVNLLVDGGQPVPGLDANDTTKWGFTLGNQVYVWRSGIGETATGALVYVAGPDLNITDLAAVLVRAGAVRAMELDINTDWVDFATFAPATATGQAAGSNGTDLLANMVGTPDRYFEPWWSRDFFTMSVRPSLVH